MFEVSAAEAKKLVDQGALLVDVREQVEWISGHAAAATHVPLGYILQSLGNFPRDEKVVVVCRSGNRSMHAVVAMREAGIDAYNLAGGMNAWESAGGDVIAAGGERGVVI